MAEVLGDSRNEIWGAVHQKTAPRGHEMNLLSVSYLFGSIYLGTFIIRLGGFICTTSTNIIDS